MHNIIHPIKRHSIQHSFLKIAVGHVSLYNANLDHETRRNFGGLFQDAPLYETAAVAGLHREFGKVMSRSGE